MRMRFWSLLCVAALVAALAGSTGVASADPSLRIMAIGDSITYGANSPDGKAYRGVLGALLRDAGYAPVITCACMNGRRVDTIRPDVDAALAASGVPDVALWFLGTNDWKNQALWPNWYGRYYDEIARVLRMSAETKAIVATVPLAIGYEGSFVNLNAWVRDITAVWLKRDFPGRVRVVELASIPQSFLAGPPTGGGDSVHPGVAGYTLMADLWFHELRRDGWV